MKNSEKQYNGPGGLLEVVLLNRDKDGYPNGRKSSFVSDKGVDISNFYDKHVLMNPNPDEAKKKRKVKNKNNKNNKNKKYNKGGVSK